MKSLCILRYAEAASCWRRTESEVGKRRGNDVEGRSSVRGVGEMGEEFCDFDEGAGPYVSYISINPLILRNITTHAHLPIYLPNHQPSKIIN